MDELNFPAGRYVFHTLSDDGVQLDIQADGSNEIDNWTDHSETQNDSAALQLSGDVRIVVRYYERTGGARLKVWWEQLPSNNAPIGWAGFSSPGIVEGWAADPDTGSQSINVHFYAVTPSGAFTFIGGTGANLAWANTGYPGNHGFQWTIPSQYRNGQLYKLYAYGLDTSGLGENGELTGSPQTPVPFQLSQ